MNVRVNFQQNSTIQLEIYQVTEDAIKNRFSETYDQVIEQTRKNRNEFVWNSISSVEELGQVRMAARNEFLSDFKNGKAQGRYLTGSFPRLPFRDWQFGLSLCSALFTHHSLLHQFFSSRIF